ncbi:MAG: flavodoxin [Aurantimonas coralicida]
MSSTRLSRRSLLAASTLLALPTLVATSPGSGARAQGSASRVLVAYFSRSGNTRVIAGQIRRATEADEFEIRPRRPYPADYEETVAQSHRERDSGFEPELESSVSDLSRYETIYLGFPIWSGTAPPVIRSFLSQHDLSGKTVLPFITHGGYGLGNSEALLAEHAEGARLAKAFALEADQERRTLEEVTDWLERSPPVR